MAREKPSCEEVAMRLASAFVILLLVATIPIVELAPSFTALILLYFSMDPWIACGGGPYPPYSSSNSKGAAQNFPEMGSIILPIALTITKAPTIVPLLSTEDADPNPPFNWPVVAPNPAP